MSDDSAAVVWLCLLWRPGGAFEVSAASANEHRIPHTNIFALFPGITKLMSPSSIHRVTHSSMNVDDSAMISI